ncbi:MAG: hypothetical protein AAFP17_01320 [Pseudomonadota bacterium]
MDWSVFRALAPFCLVAALAGSPGPATATVIDDFNAGQLITDFQFGDASGTSIENTLNSAAPGQPFDTDADFANAATNGLGQFDASGKDNDEFGTVYSDVDPITSGRIIGLMELSWAFDESTYDATEPEQVRQTLIGENPRSDQVTAQIFLERTAADEFSLTGTALGTGATSTDATVFGSVGSLIVLIDVDLDTDSYELFYSADDGANIFSGGTGSIDSSRIVESIRFVLNNDFSQDVLLVDRFAVALAAPVPLPATMVPLAVALLLLGARARATRQA